jgi:nucleotide-binding universal stress UspA family protein
MTRILIPFTDPDQGERAVRRLLDERPPTSVEIELLAVVEPLTPGKVSVFLSPKRAEALARAAATDWIGRLKPLLDGVCIKHRSQIAVGAPKKVIAEAMRRNDIDRVLIPIDAPHWWAKVLFKRRVARLSRATRHPVTVVS